MVEKRSKIGSYAGYSTAVANGYRRTSCYVTVRDGCRIAVDILHPCIDGKPVEGPLPSVVRPTGYRRSFFLGTEVHYDESRLKILKQYPVGALITPYELAPIARELVHRGYNFISVDLRGTGASFGELDQPVTLQTGYDVVDVCDWIAAQPWSDGKIGTWGRSWEAAAQIVALAARPKNITCAVPMGVGSCLDSTWYNGIFTMSFRWQWQRMRTAQDSDGLVAPVDGDENKAILREALSGRDRMYPWEAPEEQGREYAFGRYADNWLTRARTAGIQDDPALGRPPLPVESIDAMNEAAVPVYWFTGWWDLNFADYALYFHGAMKGPKKIIAGPWNHSQYAIVNEPVRWYDYWLKGIENGIMDEPSVHFATPDARGQTTWHVCDGLPLAAERRMTLHLAAAGDSPRGQLMPTAPAPHDAAFKVSYDATTGNQNLTNYLFVSDKVNYTKVNTVAGARFAFETEPMRDDTQITGAVTLQLRLAVDAVPVHLFAMLEQVDTAGRVHFITEGRLNLEFRHSAERPLAAGAAKRVGTAWRQDRELVPVSEPFDVAFDLRAVSMIIGKGNTLRLSLAGSDSGNYYTDRLEMPPTLTIFFGAEMPSAVTLPVIPPSTGLEAVFGTFEDDELLYAFE